MQVSDKVPLQFLMLRMPLFHLENAVTLLGISTKQESFARNFDKVDGEIHDMNCKIEKMEQGMANNTFTINSLYERLFALERYSRGFHLRFYKVPEQTGEDCHGVNRRNATYVSTPVYS